jgi:DNA-binding NarL/FixJ family response regulator
LVVQEPWSKQPLEAAGNCISREFASQQNRVAQQVGSLELPHLTERELELLPLLYGGLTNAEIATVARIKPRTVKGYVSRLLAKFDASNRTELMKCVMESGCLTPGGICPPRPSDEEAAERPLAAAPSS